LVNYFDKLSIITLIIYLGLLMTQINLVFDIFVPEFADLMSCCTYV